jgi:hypothetical protein
MRFDDQTATLYLNNKDIDCNKDKLLGEWIYNLWNLYNGKMKLVILDIGENDDN